MFEIITLRMICCLFMVFVAHWHGPVHLHGLATVVCVVILSNDKCGLGKRPAAGIFLNKRWRSRAKKYQLNRTPTVPEM